MVVSSSGQHLAALEGTSRHAHNTYRPHSALNWLSTSSSSRVISPTVIQVDCTCGLSTRGVRLHLGVGQTPVAEGSTSRSTK